MPFPHTTRRQALGLGAAATAAAALRSPTAALAARPALFELPVDPPAGDGWRTTAVLRAPRRFDMVGLRWARGSRAEAQVRARPRGGEWTRWVTLHPTGDHAPDGGPATPAGTDPAFMGTADEFQLRLRGTPHALRARFVRALPTASVARTIGARLRRRATARASRRTQVAGPTVPIIWRSEWGADSVPPRAAPEYGQVEMAFVHHTVNGNDYTPDQSAGIVLGIARYHRDSNGWNDIGYNFLVDRYGQVFEGRGGGIDQPVIGAQAQGYNAYSTGVACIGTFSDVAQTEAGMDALARLIGWKLALHGVPVSGSITVTSTGGSDNRYRSGTPVTLQRISGHRDGDATSCPGDVLYGQLADLRGRAARYATPVAALTMHTSKTVRGVTHSAVGGELRFADGSSPAGLPISVQYLSAGSAWTEVAGAVCGPDGQWATSVTLPATGKLRAVFTGDATRGPLQSGTIAVRVVPSLRLTPRKTRVHRRALLRFTGAMTPATPVVTVLFERRVGRRWLRVQRKRIAVTDGAFASSVRPPVPGRYRLSVTGGGVTRRRRIVAT